MGQRRIKDSERCPNCKIKKIWCYCDQLTKLDSFHYVSVIMHFREQFLTSNSAQLIPQTLKNGRLFIKNREAMIEDIDQLQAISGKAYILFPGDSSIPIEEISPCEKIHLIVPDGTWSQARKMGYRDSFLKELPRVSVKPSASSRYYLRKQGRENGVCTYEAIAYAMKHLEGEKFFNSMMEQFEIMMKVIHKSRNGISVRDRQWPEK
ncbi:MAG: tRNA-uridine aminocarboxypropyltransferase [Bdellovibrio sp.]